METLKKGWQKTPRAVRRPIVLVVGMIFVIAAGLTGWLPGPGGIPLFLIGITILATEFAWAQRLRDFTLKLVALAGTWLRAHKLLGSFLIIVGLSLAAAFSYFWYQLLR